MTIIKKDNINWDDYPLKVNKNKYLNIGMDIGRLVDEKNAQYGDAFNKSADFLKLLYPDGVKPIQYDDMLALVRVFDKQMRIANGNQGEENAWNDITGYGILKSGDKV